MRYRWVNQNQAYRQEVRGSFMWSPKRNANGARNQFYENMRDVSPGDVVFSFCDSMANIGSTGSSQPEWPVGASTSAARARMCRGTRFTHLRNAS